MKKAAEISLVYIGLVIGAGFASGREVMEYFNLRSNTSVCGILLAAFMFAAVAYIIMSKAADENIIGFDGYVDSVAGKAAGFVKGFMLIYMFCGLFTMFSGSAALVYSLSPFSKTEGALLMAAVCFFVLSFDLRGIVAVNVILVPIMICGMVYVAVCTAVFGNKETFSAFETANREIMLSAVCYAAYNTVTAGAVLVPLSGGADKKIIRRAAIAGGFIIGLLITLVWLAQGMNFDKLWDSELPMLELAALCGKSCKRVYTGVLFMAICTTAISYGFGLISHFSDKIKTRRRRIMFAAVICLAALPPAMYGFSNLVARLYSLFGYMGMIWIIWIIIDKARG